MFGLCRSETDGETFHFAIAMSPTANIVYADMERRSADTDVRFVRIAVIDRKLWTPLIASGIVAQ